MNPNKFENHPSILRTTALHIEEGLMPYRYVLREETGVQPWVVHRENMTLDGNIWKHIDFYWGAYFSSQQDAEQYFENEGWK